MNSSFEDGAPHSQCVLQTRCIPGSSDLLRQKILELFFLQNTRSILSWFQSPLYARSNTWIPLLVCWMSDNVRFPWQNIVIPVILPCNAISLTNVTTNATTETIKRSTWIRCKGSCTQQRHDPNARTQLGLSDPESRTLTIRPPHLPTQTVPLVVQ